MKFDLRTLTGAREYLEAGVFPAARQIMEEDGTHYPLAFILATCSPGGAPFEGFDGPVAVIPFPFATVAVATGLSFDDRGREVFTRAITAVAKQTKAVGVVHVCEAWQVFRSTEGGEPLLMEMPSQAPDRQEILSVVLDHRDGSIYCHAPILRDGDKATLGEFVCDEDGEGQRFGRLVNLLGRAAPAEPEA